jgi:hypothetical protein
MSENLGEWAQYPRWIVQCLVSHTVQELWGISCTPEKAYFWDAWTPHDLLNFLIGVLHENFRMPQVFGVHRLVRERLRVYKCRMFGSAE